MQRRLTKFYSIHIQSWQLTNDHSRMVKIIGIQNYAFHGAMPRSSTKYFVAKYDFRPVHIWPSTSSILERFIPQSKVDHSEIWSCVKCGFLPSGCISQFANIAIICKQCQLRIEDFSHSFGQDLRFELNVAHDLTHWGRDKMAAFSRPQFQTHFLKWKFQLRFHRSLFLRVQLIIYQHWFR